MYIRLHCVYTVYSVSPHVWKKFTFKNIALNQYGRRERENDTSENGDTAEVLTFDPSRGEEWTPHMTHI
jgi:hypothetical protein